MINEALIMNFIQCMVAEDYYSANSRLDQIIAEKVKSKIKKAVKKVVGNKKSSKMPPWLLKARMKADDADDNEPTEKKKKGLPAFLKKSKAGKK